jgi:hypothetical protein
MEDGVSDYREGDVLIDENGQRSRVVRDGRGLCLTPDLGPDDEEERHA